MPTQTGTGILLRLLFLPQPAHSWAPPSPICTLLRLLPGAARSERLWSNLTTLLPRPRDLFNVTSKPGTGSEWQVQCHIY